MKNHVSIFFKRLNHKITLAALFYCFSILILPNSVNASNGLRTIGSGPVSLGLGGGGVGKPQTSNTIILNPAGMNNVGNRVDLNFTVALPNTGFGSSAAPAGNPNAVDVTGVNDGVLIPGVSATFDFFGSEKLTAGIGTFVTAGFQVEYPVSRFPSALTSNLYDTSGRYVNFKIIPAASYKLMDNLSLGIGLDINYAFFQTDSATLLPGLPETGGRNRFDPALGIGGRVGLLYQPHEIISLGLTYQTPQFYNKFNRYQDLLTGALNFPMEFAFGLGITPIEGMLIVTDFRWINWSGIGPLGDSQEENGLEWRDQFVIIGGVQYDFAPKFGVPIQFRVGYNYGRSPISSSSAFRNLLIPLVVENHLTTGLSLRLGEHIGLDATYIYEFNNKVTDDGSFNPLGAGAFLQAKAHAFSIGLNARWGGDQE